jgi:putative NADPH-quinone reductase
MARRRVLVVQGHPDAAARHLCHVLADAYVEGATLAGHEVRVLAPAAIDFPLLRSARDWESGALPVALTSAQENILWAGHVVIVYPLWLGSLPAALKGFLEQVLRPGFAFTPATGGARWPRKGLAGRSARVVVTMGMPAPVYRWFYGAHSLRALERNMLGFVGFSPVRDTLFGGAGQVGAETLARWKAKMRALGARAA